MRIADVLECLEKIATLAAEDEDKALSLYGTVDALLSWLEQQQVEHNLHGPFNEKFHEIRFRSQILMGLQDGMGHDRDMHA